MQSMTMNEEHGICMQCDNDSFYVIDEGVLVCVECQGTYARVEMLEDDD